MDVARTFTPSRSDHGFTLVELIIALAVAAVLVAGAVPAMQHLLAQNRQAAHVNTLVSTLAFARSHAVYNGGPTVVCPSVDSAGCDDTFRWEHGWIVFHDRDRDGQRGDAEPLLRVGQPLKGTPILTSTGRRRITFRSIGARGGIGSSGGSNATFVVCPPTGFDLAPASVILSNVGRVRVMRPAAAAERARCTDGTSGD